MIPIIQLLSPRVDLDRNIYARDPAIVFPTRVDSAGVRYFLDWTNKFNDEDAGGVIFLPRFRLLPRREMEDVLATKTVMGASTVGGLAFSHVFMQALKGNEDAVSVHAFERRTLFAVLDGHGGPDLSSKAVKELPEFVAKFVVASLDRLGPAAPFVDISRAVEEAFSDSFRAYDALLLKGLEDTFAEFTASHPADFSEMDIVKFKLKETREGANRPAFAAEGCTVIMGFIPTTGDHLWTACLGDSQAVHGRLDGSRWECTALNEFHNTSNPDERLRLAAEHPGEEDVLLHNWLMGMISVTRALGDHIYKAPTDLCARYYCYSRPTQINWETVAEWPGKHNTPPYMSNQPMFSHIALAPGDVLVFASDGLRNAWQVQSLTSEELEELFVSLCGIATGGGSPEDLHLWEGKLGHRFIPVKGETTNPADWALRNILFGVDDVKLARELTLEFPKGGSMRWQDDITVLTVHV